MKEITREDWKKNPTPRMMWVWNSCYESKLKRKVIYYNGNECCDCPVSCLSEDERRTNVYQHCAEIEEPQLRRRTNYELAKWLYEGVSCGEHREFRFEGLDDVCCVYHYSYKEENEPCLEDILIRSNGGEWHEPLIEK